jgi:hypothetical protein
MAPYVNVLAPIVPSLLSLALNDNVHFFRGFPELLVKFRNILNFESLADKFRLLLLFFLERDCRQNRLGSKVPPQVDLPMRKIAIQFTRLPKLLGRLGFVTAGVLGTFPVLENSLLAQQPPNAKSSNSHRAFTASHEGNSTREAREAAIQRLPFQQLTPEATARLRSVVDNASYFRRMPAETIDCDQEMFAFLVRNPEVIVNIWDIMGVTKVSLQRTGPYQLLGNDGAGTTSKMDLVFGNETMHIYYATGSYHGSLWARELNGKCVVVLHNRPAPLPGGKQGMTATMDVFMKLDNLGADLVVKTLGPLVGKTADYNFTECAAFFSQISQTAEQNPFGMQQLAMRLNSIDPKTREQFLATSMSLAQRSGNLPDGPMAKQAINAPSVPVDKIPILSTATKVPPMDVSTRRQSDSASAQNEERVDSPTIQLIGKEEQSKSPNKR